MWHGYVVCCIFLARLWPGRHGRLGPGQMVMLHVVYSFKLETHTIYNDCSRCGRVGEWAHSQNSLRKSFIFMVLRHVSLYFTKEEPL